MSILALAKKRLSSPIFHLLRPRFFSSASTHNSDLKTHSFSIHDYLISCFGFSAAKAATISKPIAHLKSPQNPDAVRSFLEDEGFDEAGIKSLVTWRPGILLSSPKKTLEPNLRALRNIGLSASALSQIIHSGPVALQLSEAVPRILFWRDFLGGDQGALVRVFQRNRGLICHDTSGGIATKISLLQSHGISDSDIRRILCKVPAFITSSVSSMDDLLKRVKELGFQNDSGMFVTALHAIRSVSRELLKKKMDLLKSFGWSEDQFLTALRKAPTMVCLSEENLRAKMDFLLGEARCELQYITFHPNLMLFSMEKRLRPRTHVLQLLESKNLSKRKEFFRAINLTDSKFVAKYILPYKEEIPELHEVYLTACASGSE